MSDFEKIDITNDDEQKMEKGPWAKAMDVWNEIFIAKTHFRPYDTDKDIEQPYLTVHYVTDDGKTGVEARLYQESSYSNDFALVANDGDTMAMLEMAEKLLGEGINIIKIKQGNGIFRPGDNKQLLDTKLEELKNKFNR